MAPQKLFFLSYLIIFCLILGPSHETQALTESARVATETKRGHVKEDMMKIAKQVLKESFHRRLGHSFKPTRLSPTGPDPRHH